MAHHIHGRVAYHIDSQLALTGINAEVFCKRPIVLISLKSHGDKLVPIFMKPHFIQIISILHTIRLKNDNFLHENELARELLLWNLQLVLSNVDALVGFRS